MTQKIMIIAGEASGDHHAADLIKALKAKNPDYQFSGIGGNEMKAAGVELLYHISQLAILGITEVIKHLPFIRKVLAAVKKELQKDTAAIILVDYPGFNMRVARIAKKMGIPVIYYISPQLWAWGEKRVEKMRRFVDLLLVIFRFEEDFYKKHDITAHFVGHPMVDQIDITQSESDFRKENRIPETPPILGLFPGSREMEVRNLLPTMLAAAEKARKEFGCIPAIGCASHLPEELYGEICEPYPDIMLLKSQSHLLMQYSFAAMVASGTATLELGYQQTPMVVLYAVSPITYWLGRMLIKIDNIAMANIVAGKNVVPEIIQKEITVENVNRAVNRYFTDADYYKTVKKDLGRIKEVLGDGGASQRTAEKIHSFLSDL